VLARELVRAGTAFPTDVAEPVAVVGIGCRLPGNVSGPESFWQLLVDGRDAVDVVPADRWDADAFYDRDPQAPGRMTTKWGGFVDDVAGFDADFFGITPREAEAMDPQQRMLLEVAWEALEHAGLPPDSLNGSRTAAIMGLSAWDYTIVNLERRAEIDAYMSTGNPHSAAVGRISYLLGLRGPAVAVDTACSSSLVALHLACQSLRLRESDAALAGGAQLMLSPFTSIALSKWSALSPTGRCKTFDALADGFVRSEGCGVVVLKRLADATRDGDRVLAVIRGSAINQDGRSNGMTGRRDGGQRELYRDPWHRNGIGRSDRIRGAGGNLRSRCGLVRSGIGKDQPRSSGGGRRDHRFHQGDTGRGTRIHPGEFALLPVESGHRCIINPAVRPDRRRGVARRCAQSSSVVIRPQRDQCSRGTRAGPGVGAGGWV
jgi:phthiocerol/phenolphthiocerol synthesis type-I polyketide synthase D